ncbi:hypothetical protein V474_14725 [Novosphingobium barchaimii LL02]|uniref:Uncharacterized protein n=1 Tax=Novosphingobium barchaimii LL02 TaxID=1114963 RepID=A0A0J7XYN5_9SPHN|nr:hypothetical protein V474_14725 [Novosphingobium barchaimii LL02]
MQHKCVLCTREFTISNRPAWKVLTTLKDNRKTDQVTTSRELTMAFGRIANQNFIIGPTGKDRAVQYWRFS